MSNHFSVEFPDDVPAGPEYDRRKAINTIWTELLGKVPPRDTTSDSEPVRITIHDAGERGAVTISGTLEQAKIIMTDTRLKILNLIRVAIPEPMRSESAKQIVKTFTRYGEGIEQAIRQITVQESRETGKTGPLDTIVQIYDIAPDKSSVTLHITGDVDKARNILTSLNWKLLD